MHTLLVHSSGWERFATVNDRVALLTNQPTWTPLFDLGLRPGVRSIASFAAAYTRILGMNRRGRKKLSGLSATFDPMGFAEQVVRHGCVSNRPICYSCLGGVPAMRRDGDYSTIEVAAFTEGGKDGLQIRHVDGETLYLYSFGRLVIKRDSVGQKHVDTHFQYKDGKLRRILDGSDRDIAVYHYDDHGNVVREIKSVGTREDNSFGYTYGSDGAILTYAESSNGAQRLMAELFWQENRCTCVRQIVNTGDLYGHRVFITEWLDDHGNCYQRLREKEEHTNLGTPRTVPSLEQTYDISYY